MEKVLGVFHTISDIVGSFCLAALFFPNVVGLFLVVIVTFLIAGIVPTKRKIFIRISAASSGFFAIFWLIKISGVLKLFF